MAFARDFTVFVKNCISKLAFWDAHLVVSLEKAAVFFEGCPGVLEDFRKLWIAGISS